MWCKSIGFVRWLASLLILRSVGFLFYVLSVCSLFAGCLLGLQLTVPLQQQAGSSENESLVKVQKIIKEPNDGKATKPSLLLQSVGSSCIYY
jgi:hypothetical protein